MNKPLKILMKEKQQKLADLILDDKVDETKQFTSYEKAVESIQSSKILILNDQ